jgi:TonB-linked SusC/RagA family outer membrane protein
MKNENQKKECSRWKPLAALRRKLHSAPKGEQSRRFFLLACACMAFGFAAHAQGGSKVTGAVTNSSGEALAGVTVTVKGASTGAITDVAGKYSITVPAAGSVLRFSYLGYTAQEHEVGAQAVLNVTLIEDAQQLDEVVAVGYGTQRKASLTSAISQISGEEAFKDKGINNVTVALQGEVPGLVVTRTSTRPGNENSAMKIRGDISVNGNSSPLVLIDGIAGSLDELNQLEPRDIENISVLKDASAAIYGARSASGVLLVTTKRGKPGKARISYSGSVSTTIDGIKPPMTTGVEWLKMFYEAQYQDARANNPTITADSAKKVINWWVFGSTQTGTEVNTGEFYGSESLFNALVAGKTLTLDHSGQIIRFQPSNLMEEIYGQGTSQKHSVSISGASDKFGYMASMGYANNNSQLRLAEDGEKKYSVRLNMDYQATKALKIETGMSYEIRDITTPSTDVGAGWMDPWFWAIYNENGDFYDTFSGNRNPVGAV